MRLHILQHVSFEGPGYIQEWAQKQDATITYTRFYEEHYMFPDIQNIDLLIILGGPMSVNDSELPWIAKEKMFIRQCLEAGMPILGICLGAQLIAGTLGAKVHPATNKEIGWFSVSNTGKNEWPWTIFKDEPLVFHWHGEQFEIPDNATGDLTSEANTNQGFAYGKKIIGLQFHLEATSDSIEQLLLHASGDLTNDSYVQTIEQIRNGIAGSVKQNNAILEEILNTLTAF